MICKHEILCKWKDFLCCSQSQVSPNTVGVPDEPARCQVSICMREAAAKEGSEWLCAWSPRFEPQSSGDRLQAELRKPFSEGLCWPRESKLCFLGAQ